MRRILFILAFLLRATTLQAATSAIPWQSWSEQVFERAARENCLVILDLEAVWCHWCHVMDEKTYSQAEVIRLIEQNYIAVRVDQDSRPDLANRSGFLEAGALAELLRQLAADPRPIADAEVDPAVAASATLGEDVAAELRRRHREAFDPLEAGLKLSQKFLDADSLEYSLRLAAGGDPEEERRARRTLKAAAALVDPAWGGVYQYSHGGNWAKPHFEKILSFQRDNLKAYSRAYARWKDPEHRKAAAEIRGYLKNFLLSPEGAFYVSQDADLVPGQHASEYFSLSDAAAA